MKYFSLRKKTFRCATIGAVVALAAVGVASSATSSVGAAPAAPATGKAADSFGWQFDYDDAGRVTGITDSAGQDTRFQYSFDVAKRLRKIAQIRATEPSLTRELDEAGRLQSMTDGAGAVAYGYDERGRLNRVQRQGAPAVTYGYDTRDRITRLQVGDFYRVVEYTYDFLGRLASMKTPACVIQYDYATGQGSVVHTLPNGNKTIWEPPSCPLKVTPITPPALAGRVAARGSCCTWDIPFIKSCRE